MTSRPSFPPSTADVFPVDAALPELLAALDSHGAAALIAPPGSGKTTRVPPALARALPGVVLVLEPRRLAARSAARFMARQLGEEVGQTVGYRVRLDSRVSARTRVEILTEGILTRRLLADPELSGVSCVVFDEFHERSLQADLGLALCLEVRQALRPDLRLLIMSATLDPAPLRERIDGCPVVRAEGRQWPVDIRYFPPSARASAGRPDPARAVAEAARRALDEEPGSILAFLPGAAEIRRAASLLGTEEGGADPSLPPLPPGVTVCPLYGDLPPQAQDAAIAPCPPGRRKIVLATSLAETSLTIEGVRVVIDSGLSRVSRYDPATDMERLTTERVTRAEADQRAGRAGRGEPGVCRRLWAEGDPLRPARRPEMLDADLAPLLLDVLAWGALPEDLPWLAPPPAAALARARRTLELLGAAEADVSGRLRITARGERLARLPLHPRLGRMVLAAGGQTALAACLAALISERDPLRGTDAGSDIRRRLACLKNREHARLRRTAEQIFSLAGTGRPFRLPDPEEEDAAGALLSLAWPERLAQRRARGSFRLASRRGASLPEGDPLADAAWLAVAALDGGEGASLPATSASARIFLAAPISREDLESRHGHRIRGETEVAWNAREQAVTAVRRVRLDALTLEERPLPPGDDNTREEVRRAVLEGVRDLGLDCLPWTDDLRQWRARVKLLRDQEKEQGWPDVSDAALLDSLEDWLGPFLGGITRRGQFADIDLATALRGLTPWPLDRRLEQEAPASLRVPSGSSVRLDYTAEGGPVLAVKLQEMFGQTATPAVASGRVPVTVHLLSPAGRPLQVTRDLAGFWASGYAAVRAEMRGRYPKHPWPEDPLTAPPTRKTKHRSQKRTA